ncbi:MAG: excinuclease ABC subunit UvrA, partial [Myxococcota bacterium]|nr:excinuclease ABC subunit UvrA [Myxococcota bacterium]
MAKHIKITGANEHNLKNISIKIPRDQLVVITGVSGSGKSSLAHNTIYQEGQHRFLDSLSSYARQFLGQMHRPDVKHIDGLSPTLSIDQKTVNRNPRSTVGTITELNAHIRLFFARLGTPHCPVCDKALHALSPEDLVNQWLEQHSEQKIIIMAPVVMARKGEYRKLLIEAYRDGFVRARINGEIQKLDQDITLARYEKHDIELIIDRTKIQAKNRSRLIQAVETAIAKADYSLSVIIGDKYQLLSAKRSCLEHHFSAPELEPRLFSFNAPQGMCTRCNGLGYLDGFDVNRIILPDKRVDQCFAPFGERGRIPFTSLDEAAFATILKKLHIRKSLKWNKLTEEQQHQLLYGAPITYRTTHASSEGNRITTRTWDGIMPLLERVWHHTRFKGFLPYRQKHTCSACQGTRLNPVARAVQAYDKHIDDFGEASVQEIHGFFSQLQLKDEHQLVGEPIIRELKSKVQFLMSVGLDYLSLNRSAATLSGGESQRIRLAAQVGSGLQGVTYVLDEPSIGLHYRDHNRLIDVLHELKNKGNSLLIVEHDPLMMRRADYLIEVGPAAGVNGGQIVEAGPRNAFFKSTAMSAQYCRGELGLERPKERRPVSENHLSMSDVFTNNLNGVTVKIPLQRFVVVTGVSGSGKSSLIQQSLVPTLQALLSGDAVGTLPCKLDGWSNIDKLLIIDQNPIGRNPRSNTATYTGLLTHIRELLSQSTESKIRGYTKSRFSFNVSAERGGGRCEACEGAGENIIEMQFLSNVAITCEVCEGKRFSADTLEITYRKKNIHQILDMTINEAVEFFSNQRKIKRILTCLQEVGMGYVKLGQPATTLSGGEAQRIKLASELHRPNTGQTLYVLDEPSTGLHMSDVARLISVLNRLVETGNSVIVVEHDMDFIRMADWIIDVGPEGGPRGGQICGEGSPEQISTLHTATGQAIKAHFEHQEQQQLLKAIEQPYRAKRAKHPDILLKSVSTHSLRSIDVQFKQGKLNVITGPSGSGKSSLAFHTLFAEGQRRYIESLSTYARRFLGRMQKPPMRTATGLAPAIAIEQQNRGQTPRSTVATTSELHDYLRILYASISKPHCPKCAKPLQAFTAYDAAQSLKAQSDTGWIVAPIQGEKRAGIYIQQGLIRIYQNGDHKLDDSEELLVDPILIMDRGRPSRMSVPRLSQAIQSAYDLSGGMAQFISKSDGKIKKTFYKELRCTEHGALLPQALTPRHFSFNTRLGACPRCEGLGRCRDIDF